MSNTEFGVFISDELVEELDDLTAYFQSDIDHEARVRELIIRRRKGTL